MGAAVWAALGYSVGFPLHPAHCCCSSRRSRRMGHGWAVMEERSSWVEERLALVWQPASQPAFPNFSTSLPAPLHLSWASLTCEHHCSFWSKPRKCLIFNPPGATFPTPPSPQSSPTQKMPVWLMYICMVLFICFFEIKFLFIA